MSELSLRSRIRSKVSRTHLNLRQLYLYLVLIFIFFFKLFKQASHYLKDNSESLNLQAVYLKHLFSNLQIICSGRKIIYTFNNLVCGTTQRNEVSKRKHWKLNIAIKCIYFFFCIWQSDPGTSSVVASSSYLIELLLLQAEEVFMRLKEFVVHFKTGKNLWLTLKNVFVCFWLFKRW